jgi:hypothetical protein
VNSRLLHDVTRRCPKRQRQSQPANICGTPPPPPPPPREQKSEQPCDHQPTHKPWLDAALAHRSRVAPTPRIQSHTRCSFKRVRRSRATERPCVGWWLVGRVQARKKLRLQLYDARVPTFTLAPTCRGNHLPQRCVLCPSLHALAALQPRATCAFSHVAHALDLSLLPVACARRWCVTFNFGFHATLRLSCSGFA